MKFPPALRTALFVLVPMVAAFSTVSAAEPERPYLVIPDTTSPNGQYAVAWTLPNGPQIDWEKFRTGERNSNYLPDLENPEIEVEDNLIELKSGRKLGTVASGYWTLPQGTANAGLKFRPNEEFMEVAWSAQSDFVLVLYRLRSGPKWGSLRACQIEAGAVLNQMDGGSDLGAAFRSFLKRLHRQEYERVKDDPNLRFSDLKSLGGRKFSLNAVANLQNKHGNRIHRGATLKFELRPGARGKLSLRVLNFTKVDLEDEERAAL